MVERVARAISPEAFDGSFPQMQPKALQEAQDALEASHHAKLVEALRTIDAMPYYRGPLNPSEIESLRERYHKALDVAGSVLAKLGDASYRAYLQRNRDELQAVMAGAPRC
jgi:hypothetical protein